MQGKGNKQWHSSAQLVDFQEAMEYNVYFKKCDYIKFVVLFVVILIPILLF